MEAIILAGGLGTRLRDTVPDLPKPLAPINGVPFLTLLLEQLRDSSVISRAILATGYRAGQIEAHYNQNAPPLPITFSVETSPLGTGGALKQAAALATSDAIIVLNGDSYFDVDLKALVATFHPLTLAAAHVEETSRFGQLKFSSKTHQITSFVEKSASSGPGWINGGIYRIERSLLRQLPPVSSLENDLFSLLVHEEKAFAFPQAGLFIDIGTATSFAQAQTLLME
jgi:D-glycero-alpha-D-manno-heptose 1-phosphate guanylyltransferase